MLKNGLVYNPRQRHTRERCNDDRADAEVFTEIWGVHYFKPDADGINRLWVVAVAFASVYGVKKAVDTVRTFRKRAELRERLREGITPNLAQAVGPEVHQGAFEHHCGASDETVRA